MSSSLSRKLVWSLIAAAFIGPGTVTTAANFGSRTGTERWWYVLVAAAVGFLLMEMTARVTMVSGRSLGNILRARYRWLAVLLFVLVSLGCLAFEAGNLLGAFGGLDLLLPGLPRATVAVLGLLAAALLWRGNTQLIGRVLGAVVLLMGVVFVSAAALALSAGELPRVTTESDFLGGMIGLLGTTVVPYNFFLAAGLGRGQQLGDMRWGLAVSFGLGALITLAILVVGAAGGAFTSFPDLARTLGASLGPWSRLALGLGLLAAGLSSAITAPLAAALAARELLATPEQTDWAPTGRYFRAVWLTVLLAGVGVASFRLDVVQVILAAQIGNGLLLPLIAAVVVLLANRSDLLGARINSWWTNAVAFAALLFLALSTVYLFLDKFLPTDDPLLADDQREVGHLFAVLFLGVLIYRVYVQRRGGGVPPE